MCGLNNIINEHFIRNSVGDLELHLIPVSSNTNLRYFTCNTVYDYAEEKQILPRAFEI